MKLVNEADVRRMISQIDALGRLLERPPNCACVANRRNSDGDIVSMPACTSALDHMMRVARDAAGFMRSAGGGNRSSDVARPTESAVIGRENVKNHDGPEWWHHRISRDTKMLDVFCTDLAVMVAELGKVTKTDPKELAKTGQGDCAACGTFCSGAAHDRLRSGFCNTCYQAWIRAGRPDRFQFVRDRKHEIAARTEGAA